MFCFGLWYREECRTHSISSDWLSALQKSFLFSDSPWSFPVSMQLAGWWISNVFISAARWFHRVYWVIWGVNFKLSVTRLCMTRYLQHQAHAGARDREHHSLSCHKKMIKWKTGPGNFSDAQPEGLTCLTQVLRSLPQDAVPNCCFYVIVTLIVYIGSISWGELLSGRREGDNWEEIILRNFLNI